MSESIKIDEEIRREIATHIIEGKSLHERVFALDNPSHGGASHIYQMEAKAGQFFLFGIPKGRDCRGWQKRCNQ